MFSVVSTIWQRWEDMGAEGGTFGPVIRVGGRGKKSPGWNSVAFGLDFPLVRLGRGVSEVGRWFSV